MTIPHRYCRIDECDREVTHKIVYNPAGGERRTEYYCRDHAELAAEDVKDDEYGDLFLGPVEIGE